MQILEQHLIAKMAPGLSDQARIFSWPDKASDLGRPQGAAAILVRYAGVRLGESENRNRAPLLQEGRISFEIHYLCKDLRSHTGAYALMQFAHKTLSGLVPPQSTMPEGYSAGLQGFQMGSEDLIENEDMVWHWGQRWVLPIMYKRS